MPLYGKLADIHGRAVTLRIGILIFLAGSLVCAFSPTMLVLILGRGLQGIGGGALTSMGVVVLGDVATPRERGRYYAYFAVTYTSAGACGPALGGFLSDHRAKRELLADALIERETLDAEEIAAVFEGRELPKRDRVIIPTYAEKDKQSKEKRRVASIFGGPKPAAT